MRAFYSWPSPISVFRQRPSTPLTNEPSPVPYHLSLCSPLISTGTTPNQIMQKARRLHLRWQINPTLWACLASVLLKTGVPASFRSTGTSPWSPYSSLRVCYSVGFCGVCPPPEFAGNEACSCTQPFEQPLLNSCSEIFPSLSASTLSKLTR
jgi:hypothetical protein